MKKNIIVLALAIMGISGANAQTAPTEIKKPMMYLHRQKKILRN
jgi:hypothetical protein